MEKRRRMASSIRVMLRRVSHLALVMLAGAALSYTTLLILRSVQIAREEGAVPVPAPCSDDRTARFGSFTTTVELTTPGAPSDARRSCQMSWDDAWFSADPTVYNHALGTACSVLSALAYSESGYYQAGSTCPAYMERALEQLGFNRISTKSYRYRSEVLDQILNLFTQKDDTVAYAVARKDVTGSDGAARSVILVSIRGSYGAEWLSNLDFSRTDEENGTGASALGAARDAAADGILSAAATRSDAKAFSERGRDHAAYAQAADEIERELDLWISQAHAQGRAVSLLLVGHSRGGAVANLLAARTDGGAIAGANASLGAKDKVFAYTFAAPNTTTAQDAAARCFDNIFNIVNPSDIMPHLPLESWGYRRYGVTILLPGLGAPAFEDLHAAMCGRYRLLMGVDSPYDPGDVRAVQTFVREMSGSVGSARRLMTPAGIAAALAACVKSVDPVKILYGHYPATYISWMQALDDSSLTRTRSFR